MRCSSNTFKLWHDGPGAWVVSKSRSLCEGAGQYFARNSFLGAPVTKCSGSTCFKMLQVAHRFFKGLPAKTSNYGGINSRGRWASEWYATKIAAESQPHLASLHILSDASPKQSTSGISSQLWLVRSLPKSAQYQFEKIFEPFNPWYFITNKLDDNLGSPWISLKIWYPQLPRNPVERHEEGMKCRVRPTWISLQLGRCWRLLLLESEKQKKRGTRKDFAWMMSNIQTNMKETNINQ
jgi:hypothetical protein